MADHLKPTITSTYSNFVTELDGRFDDLAVGLDPAVTSATNVPTNSIRWSSAVNKWQKYNGTSWIDLTATYAINISGNAATATNGVVTTGSYSNPAWITALAGSKISGGISGNAATATKLATARNINGVAFDGTAAISVNLNNSVTFNNGGAGAASGITFNGSAARTISYNTIGAPSTTGTGATGTWAINITGSSASTTGNAATATKLATARTINGVSFDGSANITITAAANGGTADAVTVTNSDSNATYRMLWHSSNSIYSTSGISCNPSTDVIYASQLQALSDERLKTNWRNLPVDFVEKLATIKSGVYDRLDIPMTQAGSSAQDWQKLLPEVVSEDEDGTLSLAYSNAALVSVVELAKEIQMLKEKIKQLENKSWQ